MKTTTTTISRNGDSHLPVNVSRVLVNQTTSGNQFSSVPRADNFEQLLNKHNGEQATIIGNNDNSERRHTNMPSGESSDSDFDGRGGRRRSSSSGVLVVAAEINDQQNAKRQSTKEVYLFDCCGLTRELKPAHEYVATFRVLFHVFNIVVFLFGLANLGMGLWFRIDPKVYEIHKYIETQNFTIAGWIMLFGGFLACLVSFVGCCAVVKQDISLLLCYLITMIVLMLSLVSTIIMLTIYGLGSTLESFIVKELYEQIRRKTMGTDLNLSASSNHATQFMDFVQVKMGCCGALDFRDYQRLGMVIPTTCYTLAGNYINAPGCGRAIRRLMDIRAGLAVGFSLGSVLAQLATITISGLMICSIYNWRANPRPAVKNSVDELQSALN